MRDCSAASNGTGSKDIIAIIALYRPGPMDLIPELIKTETGESADHL